jgi:alpha-amylase
MPSVCCYFQVHQPGRLKRYSVFDIGRVHDYEDDPENRRILDRVAQKCYLPANALLLESIERQGGRFQVAFSLSGVVLDQFERHRPDVLASFQRLAATGCVEFLNETDSHSLAFLFSPDEFRRQVLIHRRRIRTLFGQPGRTFRNTELLYSDALAQTAEAMGYEAVLAEGAGKILGRRTPNRVYRPAGTSRIRLLLRNHRLSDAVAFRFSDRNWAEHPLTAARYARWLHRIRGKEAVINLFLDYETFGEHQWPESGIFEFLRELPGEVLKHPDFCFRTPAAAAANAAPAGELPCPEVVSWADQERDTTAWLGNAMQRDAARALYALEAGVRRRGHKALLKVWRRLQTSDHFYYMCTKWFSDGDIHRYFNPFESPYEAYIHYMNILADLSQGIHPQKELHHGNHARALPL